MEKIHGRQRARWKEHGRQGTSSRGDHLFHLILKYGLVPVKIKERSQKSVKIEPFFVQALRSTRLETYDQSERGERHRYDIATYICSKIHDRTSDILRAPVGNTPQKIDTPNGIDRKSLRWIAYIEYFTYHRAIGCETVLEFSSYPLLHRIHKRNVSEILLCRIDISLASHCNIISIIVITPRYVNCKITCSTYYRVFNEIESLK